MYTLTDLFETQRGRIFSLGIEKSLLSVSADTSLTDIMKNYSFLYDLFKLSPHTNFKENHSGCDKFLILETYNNSYLEIAFCFEKTKDSYLLRSIYTYREEGCCSEYGCSYEIWKNYIVNGIDENS